MDDQAWSRLAGAVKARRLKLGLSTRAAAGAAGINRMTWSSVEDNERKLSERLWSAVERALGWSEGSVAAILDGGEPTELAPALRPGGPRRIDLKAEYERARDQPVSWQTKFVIIGEVIDLYLEGIEAERGAGPASRSA